MNNSTRPSTRLRLSARAGALFGATLSAACTTNLTPTVAQVSGRAVELVKAGSGDATVVFESGLGSDWSVWDQVASEVAPKAQVFAYSRPGYGGSDSASEPRDATHIVENLRALLADQGYAPPYVLVGHSFGGAYLELFAKKYPAEVAALVLVDPRHRDFTASCESAGFSGCGIPASVVASLPEVERAEYEAYAHVGDEIAALRSGFGALPVRVLTSDTHGFEPEVEALWVSMLSSLADEAADGEQILFAGASHNLELERAHEVAEVILGVLPPGAN